MSEPYGQDKENLKYALLQRERWQYENIRAQLIERLGYDEFRELQREVFKGITL